MTRSIHDQKRTQSYLDLISPFTKDVPALIAELCETQELMLFARYRHARSKAEFLGMISRDIGIPKDSPEAAYLSKRWEKLFGARTPRKPTLRELANRDGRWCQYCLSKSGPFHIHHALPRQMGGPDQLCNLVLACADCNWKIGATIQLPPNWWRLHPESRFQIQARPGHRRLT